MFNLKLLSIAIGALCLCGCTQDNGSLEDGENTITQVKSIKLTNSQSGIVKQYNESSLKLYNDLSKDVTNEDVVLSPISLLEWLGIYANASCNETQSQIFEYVGVSSQEEINALCNIIVTKMPDVDKGNCDYRQNNSVWVKTGCKLAEGFKSALLNQFHADIYNRNLTSEDFNKDLKAWIKNKTNGLVEANDLNACTNSEMCVVNTIYFKGLWSDKFETSLSKDDMFNNAKGMRYNRKFMNKDSKYNYTNADGYNAVRLNYGGGAFEMLITDAPEINSEYLNRVDATLELKEFNLSMPVLKISAKLDNQISESLKAQGVKNIWMEGNKDFKPSGINISDAVRVYHEAVIEVDEDGTKAAATTVTGVVTATVAERINEIKYNHPFTVIIREKSSNLILFIGKVNK